MQWSGVPFLLSLSLSPVSIAGGIVVAFVWEVRIAFSIRRETLDFA